MTMTMRLGLNVVYAMLASACQSAEAREDLEEQLSAPMPAESLAESRMLASLGVGGVS